MWFLVGWLRVCLLCLLLLIDLMFCCCVLGYLVWFAVGWVGWCLLCRLAAFVVVLDCWFVFTVACSCVCVFGVALPVRFCCSWVCVWLLLFA